MSSSPILHRTGATVQQMELIPVCCLRKAVPHKTDPNEHSLIFPTPIPVATLPDGSGSILLKPSPGEPVGALTLAEVDGLPLGSSQIGPATPGSTAETPTGTALAARLGFCLAVTESPIVVSSIQLLIYAGDIVSYRTLPNSSYAGQVLFPLSSDEGQGLYIFRLSDAAVDAAGSFLTADSGISVAITLQKPAPAPPFVALPSGSIRVFDQRPKDVFTDRS